MSLRKLRIYIEKGLPPDSAVHRAHTDGQAWTWTEQLLWMMFRQNEVHTKILGDRLNSKKVKIPKEHPRFPWLNAGSAEKPRRFGGRGDLSAKTVMNALKRGFRSGQVRVEDQGDFTIDPHSGGDS